MSKRTIGRRNVERQHPPEGHLGTTIVDAVSDATGVPVSEMDSELNDYVDPDALDALFADRFDGTPRKGGLLIFSMCGCKVRVHGDGRVVVTPK
ncbi:hypothetical protein SAMN04487948_101519 [Halogranum amylolyticum]|uniref:Halobacterial output domain-containing protein n=1 Tax=Halogranum amylolyticum TaxID=660520 RepID=A0A1H8NFR2_9EURY|nr:HalOD1 output domain-containing protein [Halogranum amylolyticum]SEO28406.1 hypothetical protein SAMN04487948_101519 [Halogranum amylolyticum]